MDFGGEPSLQNRQVHTREQDSRPRLLGRVGPLFNAQGSASRRSAGSDRRAVCTQLLPVNMALGVEFALELPGSRLQSDIFGPTPKSVVGRPSRPITLRKILPASP